jgi:hypothetical protein
METEVRLASLSRLPGFPVAVPKCYFADYHQTTGTAILITERIAFGSGPIERLYGKCLDYELPEPLEHYQAIVKALAKLAGTHQAGHLHDSVTHLFPFNRDECVARDPIPYSALRLQNRVARYADFAAEFPQLLPQNITSPKFVAQLADTVPRFVEHENAIKQFLYSKPEFIALCHWNANIDNAWFWRNARGEIECGLFDWGRADQMNVALAIYGCLSGAEPELWNYHLDALLALFVDEFARCGAALLDPDELRLHLHLATAMMGLAYIMDAPPIIRAQIPDLAAVRSRFDTRLKENENARVPLHMMTMLLNQWQTRDFGLVLDQFLRRQARVGT